MENIQIEKLYFSLQKNQELTTFFKMDLINEMELTSNHEIIIDVPESHSFYQINTIYRNIFLCIGDLFIRSVDIKQIGLQIIIK